MKEGFYTALGTPVDEEGCLCSDSMTIQIEKQIEAGASGLLVMGSMGNEAYIRNAEYPKVAACSVQAAKGRVPVLVGVTDVSVGRVRDRIEALSEIRGIDGIVSTVPYYSTVNQEEIYSFYMGISKITAIPVYLYDLAVVTKAAILPATVKKLWKNPQIKGIKSGNLVTQRLLLRAEDRPQNFVQMFSNIDEFDIAYRYGIKRNLDGMFACTPKTARRMYQALEADDMETAADALDGILALRDLFASTPCLLSAFSYAMNLMGCRGSFAIDYQLPLPDSDRERVKIAMRQLGEI